MTGHVHLVAVGGVGMASLAGLFTEKGWKVSGSDAGVYPPMSDMLRDIGVEIREGYDPDNLKDSPDLVVVGNAVSRNNPEIEALLEKHLPYMSMPQALWEHFLKDKRRVVIAGTHGKTTTSSLVAWVLTSAGKDPSFLIGGVPRNFSRGFHLGKGEHFVVEGDEYDTAFFDKGPKFLHYGAQDAVLTAVEFDHADIYRDLDHVKEAFRKFISSIPESGYLAVCADYTHALDVSRDALCRREMYSASGKGLAGMGGLGGIWRTENNMVWCGEKPVGQWKLSPSLAGNLNVMNALGAAAVCTRLGLGFGEIAEGLETFEGVKRRQEIAGEERGIVVVDDFAHHPTAIRETISAIRQRYPGRRLWAVYEPRSNTSRRNVFQKEVPVALAGADSVIIAGVFNPGKIDPGQRFSPEAAVKDVQSLGKTAAFIETPEGIVKHLISHAKKGDVVLVMSNGPFGGLPSRLLESLRGTKRRRTSTATS